MGTNKQPLPESLAGHASWSEQDWDWDPRQMVAGPKQQQQGRSAAAAEPASGGCRVVPRLEKELSAALVPGSSSELAPGGNAGARRSPSDSSGSGGGSGSAAPKRARGRQAAAKAAACQADACSADLSCLTYYHVRNKICEAHIKADVFLREGQELRFCQRCGHAHALDEFDAGKHSCRAQLEKHNARRRKRQGAKAQGAPVKARAGSRKRLPIVEDEDLTQEEEQIAPRRQEGHMESAHADVVQHVFDAAPPRQVVPQQRQQQQQQLPNDFGLGTLADRSGDDSKVAPPPLPVLDFNPPELPAGGEQDGDVLAEDLSWWLTQQLSAVDDDQGAVDAQPPAIALTASLAGVRFASSDFELAAELMQPPRNPLGGQDATSAVHSVQLSSAPQLTQQAMLTTVSVKLFGMTPAELPPDLRSQLMTWFDGRVASMEGYLRPGCTHLLVQATLDMQAQEEEELRQVAHPVAKPTCCGSKRRAPEPAVAGATEDGDARAVKRVVAEMLRSGDALWRTKTMLVQTGASVSLVHHGRVHGSWTIDAASPERAVPAIVAATPPVLLSGAPAARLAVTGVNLMQNDCELVFRQHGAYVVADRAQCADCACCAPVKSCCAGGGTAPPSKTWEQKCCGCCVAKLQQLSITSSEAPAAAAPSCCGTEATVSQAAKLQTVRLQMAQPLSPGLLHVDVHLGAIMAAQGGRALVVDSPAVQQELLAHAERFPAQVPTWVEALGVVYEWVGDRSKVRYELAERIASRMLHWAVEHGMRATAQQLLSLLQSELMATAAALPVTHKLSALDGLALLSQADQACKAAQLTRVARLGCTDDLSLLHQAVRSQSPGMVADVLAWGEDAGAPWRCDAAGPRGLTPLHLAALAADPATAAQLLLLLMSRCAPGAGAWRGAAASEGHSAASFAQRAGRESLTSMLDMSAGVTALPPLRLHQRQQQQQQQHLQQPQQQQQPPRSCCQKASDVKSSAVLDAPSTPRRCKCQGDCPCARAAEPCASCLSSDDEEGCCGSKDGTCSCCAAAALPGPAAASAARPASRCCH